MDLPFSVAVSYAAPMHADKVCPREDKRGVDLICEVLSFCKLGYDGPNAASNAVDYAKFFSRSHDAVIRVLVKLAV